MEKKSPLISIVVPVYKVEPYLHECVDSILGQTYGNFELILVDDGSPDRCGAICDTYAEKDSRVKVIHKENGGLSDARNAGIDVARGEYITFVDSDDYLHASYLKDMLSAALKYHASIVQCNFTHEAGALGTENASQQKTTLFSKEEALRDMLEMKIVQVNAWAKLYQRNLFQNVRYPYGRINEDNLTTYQTIWQADSPIVCLSRYDYFYRVNLEGIMNGSFSSKRYEVLSFADEIRAYLGDSAEPFQKEINYAEMRLAFRLYNECIQKGQASHFKAQQNRIYRYLSALDSKSIPMETKYRFMLALLKCNKTLYAWTIQKMRR